MVRNGFVKMYRLWRRHLQPLAIVILVLTSFRSAIADWNDVPTGSMRPSIVEGDRIFVNKLAYGLKVPFTTIHLATWGGPARGEVVVFNSPKDGTRLVKRVVGLPGDTIEMRDERLLVNGKSLDYSRTGAGLAEKLDGRSHRVQFIPQINAMRSFGPVHVPAGEYFMLGDNRDNSADSRYIGTVKRDQILGRSSTIALSFDPSKHYMPRWSRFFIPMD